ncbi:putative 50S ribosomal protein L21 [Besnoitia besnoiti]|uniref:Large ribosomal subunit protein bL21m n=1 Tax=Besnoitia besnoiti TaxID=94643 RepID=A0A2A9M6K2_BESBE|nr:putative 50S ribosomal protein L21 [Besnoitia besnoiti]PFH32814.1 putative 50S ribosomal protein L21 [Besnoitia besnoiti]
MLARCCLGQRSLPSRSVRQGPAGKLVVRSRATFGTLIEAGSGRTSLPSRYEAAKAKHRRWLTVTSSARQVRKGVRRCSSLALSSGVCNSTSSVLRQPLRPNTGHNSRRGSSSLNFNTAVADHIACCGSSSSSPSPLMTSLPFQVMSTRSSSFLSPCRTTCLSSCAFGMGSHSCCRFSSGRCMGIPSVSCLRVRMQSHADFVECPFQAQDQLTGDKTAVHLHPFGCSHAPLLGTQGLRASLPFLPVSRHLGQVFPPSASHFVRSVMMYPQRRVIGHRIEIFRGKHRRRRMVPPRVPLHPLAANTSEETASKDMNLFETYRDLQLRWRKTCRQRKKKFNIARKWKMPRNIRPLPDPAWALVFHVNPKQSYRRGRSTFNRARRTGPGRENVQEYSEASTGDSSDFVAVNGGGDTAQGLISQGGTADLRERETLLQHVALNPEEGRVEGRGRLDPLVPGWGKGGPSPAWLRFLKQTPQDELFCVMKSNVSTQHKVTAGDLIQAEKLHRKQAGDKIVFGTVMLVGSRDWTIIGKPTVPFAKVEATVEEQTLAGETLSFFYRKSRRVSRFRRIRHCVTMLRIDRIVVDPEMTVDPPPPKPDRLLDLWANRWLYPDELEGIKRDESGTPVAAEIYDGAEHQKGSYQRRGLTASYRWHPDPQSSHWRP